MAEEIERKYLVVDDAWKDLPHDEVLQLEQGYIPQDQRNGIRLYIVFPDDDSIVAQITIESNSQSYSFDGIREEKLGEFAKLKALSAYNAQTSELILTGRTEARARIQQSDIDEDKAIFAIKDYAPDNRSERQEFEVCVPIDDAQHVLRIFAENTVSKKRTVIPFGGNKWEVDSYLGNNVGLVTVDVEVPNRASFEGLEMLPSARDDITDVEELRNNVLAVHGVPDAFKRTI